MEGGHKPGIPGIIREFKTQTKCHGKIREFKEKCKVSGKYQGIISFIVQYMLN